MLDPLTPAWSSIDALDLDDAPVVEGNSLAFSVDRQKGRVSVVAPGIVRLTLGDLPSFDYGMLTGAFEPEPAEGLVDDETCELVADDLRILLEPEPFRLTIERRGEALIKPAGDAHFVRPYRLPPLARHDKGWCFTFDLESHEPVYGHGEKWSAVNHRGQLIKSWNEDALGVNAEISYLNVPFAWSPRGWGVLAHTPARVHHGVGYPAWSHRAYVLDVADLCLDLFFIVADSPPEILERYTRLTGRVAEVPRWSLGVWLSYAYHEEPASIIETAQEARERGVPADVFVLDGRTWLDTGTRFAFEWDQDRFVEPKRLTAQLHELDFKICNWEYPLVSIHHPLHTELALSGHLLADKQTGEPLLYEWDDEPFDSVLTPLPPSAIVDFTSESAFADWRQRHESLFETGIDAIKADFGEQVPDNALAANGDDGARLHNVYALLYSRCVFEALATYQNEPPMMFQRAGWTGGQRYPIHWGGDPQADWGGLAASIRGALSAGLTGFACFATDIGGFYAGPPESELFVRWTQVGVFASHMRFHGIGRREPWAFGAEVERLVAPYLDLRYRLIPYIEGCLRIARETGMPVMRAMVLGCPDEPESWGYDTQYFFGPDILVCPILQPGGQLKGYLPRGFWYDPETGERFEGGGSFTRSLPLDRFCWFVREGAMLAMGPRVQHTGELEGVAPVECMEVYGKPAFEPCMVDAPRLREPTGGVIVVEQVPETADVEAYGPIAVHRKGTDLFVTKA